MPGSIIQICPQCAKDTPFRACLMVVAEILEEGVTAFAINEVQEHDGDMMNGLSASRFLWNEVVFTGGTVAYLPPQSVLDDIIKEIQ